MKKIVLLLLLLTGTSYSSDRVGQDNIVELSDMLTQLWDEILPATSTPYKQLDTTTATNLLNWSANNAAHELFAVERDTTIIIAANTYWYNLPSDFYKIPPDQAAFGAVAIDDADGLEYGMQQMNTGQIGLERLTGTTGEIPSRYLIRKHKVYIEPVNDAGDSVRLYYAAHANILDTVGGADTTNVDLEYIQYVILKAAEKYLQATNWGNKQDYANGRLAIVQAKLLMEEKRLGVTRQSGLEDIVK